MRRAVAVTLVVALVLAAAGLLAWPFVQQWRTTQVAADAQRELREELPTAVPTSRTAAAARTHPVAAAAERGQALAEMRIPRFGRDWSWVVVEGTGLDQLDLGPGHYAGTPLPGERGNVAFAGHRAGHGDPFLDFDRLRVGDEVRIEQAGTAWTYRLTTDPEIIPVTADWVLDPLAGRSLTLTTCWPRYGSSKRLYVRGELVEIGSGRAASQAGAQGS